MVAENTTIGVILATMAFFTLVAFFAIHGWSFLQRCKNDLRILSVFFTKWKKCYFSHQCCCLSHQYMSA